MGDAGKRVAGKSGTPAREAVMSDSFTRLKEREEQVICRTYGRYPLAVAEARGCRLRDLDGREYVDLLAGIAVANVGHSRPDLAQVMAREAQKLVHVSNLFYQEEQVVLAEKLLATCAMGQQGQLGAGGKVFFCNSGAEANEAAIKLARRYMQRHRQREACEIVTLSGSFHGRTLATLTATGQDKIKDGFAPLPEGFVIVPWGDLRALAEAIGERTAAVLVEVVQGEGGVRPMTEAYAKGIEALCRERDVLFMVDEIQSGMGRTGAMWAFQRYGLTPDVFTAAKALANGLPMGAMIATDEAAKGFVPGSHATTFGGGGVLAAVASAVLDILVAEGLVERARDLGAWALDLFEALRADFPDKVAEVRGMGLMLGIELAFPAQGVWKTLLDAGFVLNCTQERVLRLLPPLTIAKKDIEDFAAALRTALAAV